MVGSGPADLGSNPGETTKLQNRLIGLVFVKHIDTMGVTLGTTEELMTFAKIFFGTLVFAGIYFLARHFRDGLALPGAPRFDRTVLLLGMWCFAGLLIDVWAHKHGEVDNSFFTPWHAVWYSGFTAFAGYITFALWRLYDGDFPKTVSMIKEFFGQMPMGYSLGVVGMIVFATSGFADMLWHTFFGIEGGTDILLSPAHLGLAAGLIFSVMTPVMAAWHNPNSGTNGLSSQILILFGIGAAWGVITLFTSYSHPLTLDFNSMCETLDPCGDRNEGLERGVTSVLLQSLILSGLILWFMKRWKPVAGSFTVLMLINGLAIAANAPGELKEAWKHVMVPLFSGIFIDIFYSKLGHRIRWFSFFVPVIYTTAWMIGLIITRGWDYGTAHGNIVMAPLGWSIHATLGAIFLAGCMGLLASILTHPPEIPMKDAEENIS